jgi:hypothetical protein
MDPLPKTPFNKKTLIARICISSLIEILSQPIFRQPVAHARRQETHKRE